MALFQQFNAQNIPLTSYFSYLVITVNIFIGQVIVFAVYGIYFVDPSLEQSLVRTAVYQSVSLCSREVCVVRDNDGQ